MTQLVGVGVGLVDDPYATQKDATDSGTGTDTLTAPLNISFYVNPEWEFEPLGCRVLRDTKDELLPATRDYTEDVPGRHGVFDFGTEFAARWLQLRVGRTVTSSDWADVRRNMAKYLSPLDGEKNLVFFNEPDRTYWVKYSGNMWLSQEFPWIEFAIPFRMNTPFMIRTFPKTLAGSGTLTNDGTFETPLTITITGAVTNPSVVVGTSTLTWTGVVAAGKQLIIDTDAMTVTYDGANGLGTYSGGFPKLAAGNTSVTAAAAGTTLFTWRDRWV